MTDQTTTSTEQPAGVCPWCSAALPSAGLPRCPTCNAVLVSEVDESLPGLTAIDAGAIIRAKQGALRPKSRLLSWLSGEDDDDVFTKAEGNALEPPDLAVRREIFRLELEAEVANLQAENEAIMAEAVAEGRVVEVPPELADAAGVEVPVAEGATSGFEGADADAAPGADGATDAPAAEVVTDAPATGGKRRGRGKSG